MSKWGQPKRPKRAVTKWELFSKQVVNGHVRYMWRSNHGDRIERVNSDYTWIDSTGARYDLCARNLSEAKKEVTELLYQGKPDDV